MFRGSGKGYEIGRFGRIWVMRELGMRDVIEIESRYRGVGI